MIYGIRVYLKICLKQTIVYIIEATGPSFVPILIELEKINSHIIFISFM